MKSNLIGQEFGRLKVLRDSTRRKKGKAFWTCLCLCGNIIEARTDHLKLGYTKSCGCLHKDIITKHGDYRTKLYRIWTNMIGRCYHKATTAYKYYGLKGIEVCKEWRNNYNAFKFWAFLSGYKEGLSIDRLDSCGNYEPSNCQWLTKEKNLDKEWKERKKK